MDRCSSSQTVSHALLLCQYPPITTSSSLLHAASAPRNDADFRRVSKLLRYSRHLVQTYNLVILAIILLFTIRHWRGKLLRRRSARKGDDDVEHIDGNTSSSSGSSTFQGTPSESSIESGLKAVETTSLLSTSLPPRRHRPRFAALHAFLIYQPDRPIPLINRPLPPNNVTLSVLLLILINVFYSVFQLNLLSTSPHDLFILSDRISLLFSANLPLLYLLAAKNQPLLYLTGYSYTSLNIIHRRLASSLCLLALLHSVGMTWVWYLLLRPIGLTLARFLFSRIIILGILALICYELLYLTSLSAFRARRYELFLVLHILLQALALPLLFFHASTSRPYVIIALVIFATDRLYFRLYQNRLTVPSSSITLEVMPDGETVLLTALVPRSESTSQSNFHQNLTQGWNAIDHVFLAIPSLSRFQSHPFTIACTSPSKPSTSTQLTYTHHISPSTSTSPTENRLKLLIRAQSGFSRTLLNHALISQTLPSLSLDGPYGTSQTLDMLSDKKDIMLIAGGSGIAVLWPLFHHLLHSHRPTAQPGPQVRLSWVVHRTEHIKWLDGLQDQDECTHSAKDFRIRIYDTQKMGSRPTIESMLWANIDNQHPWFNRTHPSSSRSGVGFVVAGPDSLNRLVTNYVSSLVRRGAPNAEVAVEKFGW